jgi:hypothetical protein
MYNEDIGADAEVGEEDDSPKFESFEQYSKSTISFDILNIDIIKLKDINPFIDSVDNEETKSVTDLKKLLGEKRKYKSNKIEKIRESKRNWNQKNIIKRFLIQNNILDFINISIKDPSQKLRKLEPNIFNKEYKKISDIIDFSLKEIYSKNICKNRDNLDIDHNIKIIKQIEKNSSLDRKMNLSLRDVLRRFFKFPLENKLIEFEKDFEEGLIDYEKYYISLLNDDKKKHNYTFMKKFINNLNDLKNIVIKKSEKTTISTYDHI